MESEVRQKLHVPFDELEIGDKFHIVNSVMMGAVPESLAFRKVNEKEAELLGDGTIIQIRPGTNTEIIKSV